VARTVASFEAPVESTHHPLLAVIGALRDVIAAQAVPFV
jgi:hypothetical protein